MPDGRIVVTFYSGWVCFYDVKTKKWTTFAEGLWYGLELEREIGKHEGTVLGHIPRRTHNGQASRRGLGRAAASQIVSDAVGVGLISLPAA